MSVVNKMLQDLEARKSQPDEVNADYQPPQKKQPKWIYLALLVVAIAAITFSFLDIKQLFGSKDKIVTPEIASVPTQSVTKKLMVVPQETPAPEQTVTQIETVQPASSQIDNAIVDSEITTTNEIANPEASETQPLVAASKNIPVTEPPPLTTQPAVNTQPLEVPQKQTSFTMSGSTKKNQSTNLKQRIAESLNNNDIDLAQSLLSELLLDEPNNLKARKKLASLYFAQGNYAQTKQLLLRGIDLEPQQTDFRLMLARLYVVQDNPEQAMQVMIDNEPNVINQSEYLAYRAALAQQLKQPQVAKADYLALAATEATNAKWWLGLAIALDQLAEANNAIKAYEKAYSLGQLDDSVDEFIQQRISVLAGTQ